MSSATRRGPIFKYGPLVLTLAVIACVAYLKGWG